MTKLRFFACAGFLAAAPLAWPQAAPPTAYTITEAVIGGVAGTTNTIYRNGNKVMSVIDYPADGATPAHRTFTLRDLQAKTSYTWDPAAKPPACGAATFSGDWGDPFAMTGELNDGIAKGDFKPAGAETIAGVPVQVYSGSSAAGSEKAWFDKRSGLVMRVAYTPAGSAAAMTMIDIKKVTFGPPPASMFALPAYCAGAHPPPSAADVIAEETGDNAANYVNGMYGPGSKNNCSVVLRVVNAKSMTPITKIQVAMDTAIYPDNAPASYTFGVGDDGTTTYSGGHVVEITNRVHNGVVRLGLPPDHFQLGVNLIEPHHGGSVGLVYRQCFAPTTVLLYVVKDYLKPTESGDFLWVKAGKYATPPAQ